jgi:hypothetical protein
MDGSRQPAARDTIRVWDPFVRIFHWAFAAAVLVALVTGLLLPPTTITVHIIAGVAAVALAASRTIWGLLGPAYARIENAGLDPQTAQTIAGYLAANAADAHGSRTMEGLSPNDVPLRITDTPFWIDAHEEVSAARFTAPAVKSKSNCLACHSDKGGDGGDD